MFRLRFGSLTAVLLAALDGSILIAQDGTPAFSDQAHAAGIYFVHTNPIFFTQLDYTGGGAAGDFNRDGWVDLFAVSGGTGNDHLFINNQDGTFTDRAVEWGLNVAHLGKGATVGDYNGDGWLDLYVTSAGPTTGEAPGHHKLFRNNGNNSFTNVATAAGVNATSPTTQGGFGSAFGDYDLDGDLDLFVAGFSGSSANNASRIYRNNGNGTFTDVTTAIGFWSGTGFGVSGFSPRFADMDGDRYPELILAADFDSSRYFRNDTDGTFTDVTAAVGAGLDENGMGQTLADYDNDGDFDWYVTSIYWPSKSWTGNKLYLNSQTGALTWAGYPAGCHDGGYGWGAVSVDVDHDGFVDIAETNGDNGTFMFLNEQSYLWMNDGDGTYTESALAYGLAHFDAGRGMLDLDYDRDGDQDLVIFSNFGPVSLWRNDLGGTQIAWLRVVLDTTPNDELAPDGYGAVLTATVGATTRYRHVFGGDNFQSCSELVAHFGLAAATTVDELRVDWPNGSATVLNGVAVNQTLVVLPPEDDAWTRVGLGIGGNNGVPQLRGQGALTAGSPTTLSLTSGKPSSLAYLIVSPIAIMAPFKGGTLVPAATLMLFVSTNAAGSFSATANWPGGIPSGAQLWFQAWQQDASGILGFISSNGLRAAVP